jgi:hypothetical protein
LDLLGRKFLAIPLAMNQVHGAHFSISKRTISTD